MDGGRAAFGAPRDAASMTPDVDCAQSVVVEMGSGLTSSAPHVRARPRKPLLPKGTTIDSVLSLSLLAQAGMLVRLGVTLGTADGFDPATALVPVLPSNIIGCFILGALCDGKAVAASLRSAGAPSDGKTLEAISAEPLPLVPGLSASWAPLLLGLRTGFCGSLTSYSSWNQVPAQLLSSCVGIWGRGDVCVWGGVCLCVCVLFAPPHHLTAQTPPPRAQ